MRLFLDICQGLGLGAATGVRPFLPALLTGALATADLGVDFDHTSYSFLESPVWLLVLVILLVVAFLLRGYLENQAGGYALAAVSIALGALLFAGTLADHGYASWPGWSAAPPRRPSAGPRRAGCSPGRRSAWTAPPAPPCPSTSRRPASSWRGSACWPPPLGVVALAALGWLRLGGQRRDDQKYAGLRILR